LRFFRRACNCLKYSGPRLAICFPPFRPSLTAAGSFFFGKIRRSNFILLTVLCMKNNRAPMRSTSELRSLSVLRTAALVALPAGAAGSIGFMLRAGHRNPSRILLILFAIWVLSPFVALVFATIISKDWSVLTRTTLYGVMLVLTVSSLAIYGDVALGTPRAKTAFAFLVVPPASWLLIAITISTAALISRGRSARSSDN
jgi:hypothetical protein